MPGRMTAGRLREDRTTGIGAAGRRGLDRFPHGHGRKGSATKRFGARRVARIVAPAALAGAAVLLAVACAAPALAAPSILRPETPQAEQIKSLAVSLFVISAVILFGVEAVLLAAIFRFRGRPEEMARQTHGDNTIEAVWTLIPAILVIIIFIMTARTMDSLDLPGGDVNLKVTGHQWWWEVQYEAEGFATANEIHVPEGREIGIDLESADVIHSFWVPQIGGKTDLVPGHTNHTGFLAATRGTYLGECAEFCGLQHAHMRFYLVVESPIDFSAWVKRQQQPAAEPTDPVAVRGKEVFFSVSCAGCHAIRGTEAAGALGPDLTHVGGRLSLAAGTLDNTRENLVLWLRDPQAAKPGNLMPTPQLEDAQLADLAAYLEGLE
ncbi:MAG: cytochrome c oxidase subunit II [Thermoleophilia bacterium]